MEYLLFLWHMMPTIAVVVLSLVVLRAVSVRVVWRSRETRRLDDELA